jgi:hypothetical protein
MDIGRLGKKRVRNREYRYSHTAVIYIELFSRPLSFFWQEVEFIGHERVLVASKLEEGMEIGRGDAHQPAKAMGWNVAALDHPPHRLGAKLQDLGGFLDGQQGLVGQ